MTSTKNATVTEQNANVGACDTASTPAVQPDSLIPSPEERKLMAVLGERIDARPEPLAGLMRSSLRLASGRIIHLATDLNPYGHFQFLIRLQRELRRAETDGTPELFLVPDAEGVTYPELIEAWVEEGQWITTQREARVVIETGPAVNMLSDAMDGAEAVRQRMQVAIDGNGSEPEVAEALRLHIWDRRRSPTSRPSMLNHLGLAASSIRNLSAEVRKAQETPPEEVPENVRELEGEALREAERQLSPWVLSVQEAVMALELMLPMVDQAIHDLASAVDGRRKPATIEVWTHPVQALVMAQELTLNRFLRHAARTASSHRLPILVNLLAPRRGPDNEPVSAPDPDSPPAEGETVIPFNEQEEGESDSQTSSQAAANNEATAAAGTQAGKENPEESPRAEKGEESTAPDQQVPAEESSQARQDRSG